MKFAALKTSARTSLNGRWTGAVTISLCYLIIAYGMTTLLLLVTRSDSTRAAASAYGIAVILSLLLRVFAAGLEYYFLKLSRDDDLSIGDLVAGFRSQPDRFLISGFLILLPAFLFPLPFTVLALSRTVIIIWCLICGIWGLYFSLAFSMTDLILFDNPQMGALPAMKKSRQLMRGHMLRLLVFMLSFIGWYALVLLSVGIAALWILPYLSESLCCFYRNLLGEQ